MKFKGEQNFQHENEQKKGVLIAYLGTPDSPDVLSVRRYLKEFLSDPRIIEVPKIIWWFVLNIFILNFRSSTQLGYTSQYGLMEDRLY